MNIRDKTVLVVPRIAKVGVISLSPYSLGLQPVFPSTMLARTVAVVVLVALAAATASADVADPATPRFRQQSLSSATSKNVRTVRSCERCDDAVAVESDLSAAVAV